MNSARHSDGNQPSEHQLEKLLNEQEFSRLTGRSVASARRDRLLGIGCPFVKLGHLVRYRPADIKAFLDRNVRNTRDVEVA